MQHRGISWMNPSADIISLMATKITAQLAQLWHSEAFHRGGRFAGGWNGPFYFQPFRFLSLCAVSIPVSSISMKELRRGMSRVEQFTSAGQRLYIASYNSIKWTNKAVPVVFQTQVNFNLIPTLLRAKGLLPVVWAAWCTASPFQKGMLRSPLAPTLWILLRVSLLWGYS